MECPHVPAIVNPLGIKRVSHAAETLFSFVHRPCLSTAHSLVPRCMHSGCTRPSAGCTYACVHCVYYACATHRDSSKSHLRAHFSDKNHALFLSVDHGRLFCAVCVDFVFNPFLDSAIELQKRIALTARRNFLSSPSPLDDTPSTQIGNGGVAESQDSLRRKRSKRRRVMALPFWVPTDKELSVIGQNSARTAHGRIDPIPPVGLYNLGNSCYMNSVLQAFLNAPPLRCYFLSDDHRPQCAHTPKSDCLACAMDNLICDSYRGLRPRSPLNQTSSNGGGESKEETPFLVPQRILEIIWRNADNLATYAQHDAHEFLIAALNLLNRHCRRPCRTSSNIEPSVADARTVARSPEGSLGHPTPNNPTSPVANLRANKDGNFAANKISNSKPKSPMTSIVNTLFSGILQSDVICRVCGNSSPTLEKFYDVSLDVDKVSKPPSARRSRATSPVKESGTPRASTPTSRGTNAASVLNAQKFAQAIGSDATSIIPEIPKYSAAESEFDKMSGRTTSFLDAENLSNSELEGANSLFECLSRFTEPEILGPMSKMYCSVCGKYEEAMKQMSIRSLPAIVSFHFKRFEQSFAKVRKSEMVKIDTPVEFPVDGLDLTPFQTSSVLRRRVMQQHAENKGISTCAGDASALANSTVDTGRRKSLARPNQDALYDLFAIVNHNGTIDSGHYTTLIRRNGEWYRCDDEKVSKVSIGSTSFRSEEAYLVFYVQRTPNLQY